MYQCEGAVGQAWRDSGIKREDFWLTSKLDNCDHAADRVGKACREQLKELQTEYLDLYLIHWPLTGKAGPTLDPPIKETWQAMEVSLQFLSFTSRTFSYKHSVLVISVKTIKDHEHKCF